MSCRIEENGTQGRQAFIHFLKQQTVFNAYSDHHIKRMVGAFLDGLRLALLNRHHINLGSVGYLIVEPITRKSVTLHFSDTPSTTECCGYTARLRKQPPSDNRVLTRAWHQELRYVIQMSPLDVKLSDNDAQLLFVEWVVFLRRALQAEYRVEIRGLGAFNVHRRAGGKVFNRHNRVMVNARGSQYFKFKPARSLRDAMREMKCP